jgi:hypothetical protein
VPDLKTDALIERLGHTFDSHNVSSYGVSSEVAARRYAPFLSTVSQVRTRAAGPNTDAAVADIGVSAKVPTLRSSKQHCE